jgi:hypothetical protein
MEPNQVADPATPVDPNTPPADPAQPPAQPQTVPVSVLVGERRQAKGKIDSLTARIQELESAQAPKTPVNQTEEDKTRDAWWDRLKLKDPLAKIDAMEKKIVDLEGKAALGERANNTLMAQTSRAMDKAEKIAEESCDKELTGIGFTKETWNGFVASQMSEDDVAELFANPKFMHDIVKRCKALVQPKINMNKANAASIVNNLPRTPGVGGTPPAPPANEPLKVGKQLHKRAFERLQGVMGAEGG